MLTLLPTGDASAIDSKCLDIISVTPEAAPEKFVPERFASERIAPVRFVSCRLRRSVICPSRLTCRVRQVK
jgi:hypothetical protein